MRINLHTYKHVYTHCTYSQRHSKPHSHSAKSRHEKKASWPAGLAKPNASEKDQRRY